jgi:hypothetical protein
MTVVQQIEDPRYLSQTVSAGSVPSFTSTDAKSLTPPRRGAGLNKPVTDDSCPSCASCPSWWPAQRRDGGVTANAVGSGTGTG